MSQKRYYPTALALYITYFVLGISSSVMGHYKQEFAALWGAVPGADGLYDISSVVAVIAAIGLGRLIAFPVAGPLSDKLGRKLSALIGCALYAVFFAGITYTGNLYWGYALAVVSGMGNSFLDTSITPSCMEIFKEKGTIANVFTKLAISLSQFLLPFAIIAVDRGGLPFNTVFLAAAAIIIIDGIAIIFLPFPKREQPEAKQTGKKKKMRFTPSAAILVALGFTTSTTFMLWMNCNQELGALYGLTNPSMIQTWYSLGIVAALFVNAALLNKGIKPAKILVVFPCCAFAALAVVYLVQLPAICLVGGFLIGFFAAGGVLQLVTSVANEMFPKNRGVITSIVMISSSVANYAVLNAASLITRVSGMNGPRYVLLFNMAVTLIGIVLAVILNKRIDIDTAAHAEPAAE